jgi:hypothetical protein
VDDDVYDAVVDDDIDDAAFAIVNVVAVVAADTHDDKD